MNRIRRLATLLLAAGIGLAAGPSHASNGKATLAAGSGDGHVLVIGEGNTLWAWGANASGQIGDGTTTLRRAPVRVSTTADWRYVAAGSAHSLAIKTDGSLWAWGANDLGQLGTGLTEGSSVPVRIATDITSGGQPVRWIAVAAAASYSMALTEAGHLYIWGEYPDPGVEFVGVSRNSRIPVRVGSSADTYFGIAAGYGHVLALRGAPSASTGTLVAWGLNIYGQLGIGHTSPREPIVEVETAAGTTASDWSMVSAGTAGSFGIRGDVLYAWGSSLTGELGLGTIDPSNPPLRPRSVGSGFTLVVAGTSHTLALKGSQLWGWGSNGQGELGLPLFNSSGQFIVGNDRRTSPIQISTDSGYTAVAPGAGFTVALRNGVILSTGTNTDGQLGNGSSATGQYGLGEAAFGFPDLRIVEIRTIPASFQPGDTITVEAVLANDGSGAVPAGSGAVVGVRLSADPEWETSTVVLNDNVPITNRIGPGQTGIATASVTVPGSQIAGVYYVVARADRTGIIAEINETNNDAVGASSYQFLPDLTVESADIEFAAGLDLNRQDDLTVTVRVSNAGQVNLPAGSGVIGRIVLTSDAILGNADDVSLASFTITGAITRQIAGVPGLSDPIVVTAPIPGSANPGTYYVGVIVDDTAILEELSEDNNVRVRTSQTLTISEASAIPLAQAIDLQFLDFTDPFFNTPAPFTAPAITFSGGASWYGIAADLPPGVTDGDVGRSPSLANAGDTATFGLELKGPLTVTFRWRIMSEADAVRFTMDGQVLAEIDGDEDWQTVQLVVPGANPPRRLEWTYVRNSSIQADPEAVAYIDNLTLTGINLPDLLVSQLDYNSEGTEIFVIGQDTPLDIQIVGINRGVPVPPSSLPASNQFEVEVRLSRDKVWGNADDYVIGRLDEIERLGANQRFVYARLVDFDDCALATGNYYLGVRVDSGGLYTEYDEDNNIRWSDNADIRAERRPQLRVRNLRYAPGIYYREQEILANFEVANVGCEDIPPGYNFQTEVRLVGFVYDYSVESNGGLRVTIARQDPLQRTLATILDGGGIRAGEAAEFKGSFQIPRYLEKDLYPTYHPAKPNYNENDIIPRFPDYAIEVDDSTTPKGFPLPIYGTNHGTERNPVFFYFEFESTANLPLVEDIIVQTIGSTEVDLDTFFETAYTGSAIFILETPAAETFDDFVAKWGFAGGADDDLDGDGFTNFQEFALVSDPRLSRFIGANADTQGTPGIGLVDIAVPVDGQTQTFQYLSAAFNMLSRYSNGGGISYVVEFADDAGFTTNVTTVTLPPGVEYTGLRNIPGVVSVMDNGYSYRVLVRDTVAINGLASRFARVRLVAAP